MVSETQHTPGPWKVRLDRVDGDWSQDDVMTTSEPSRRICNVYGGLTYPIGLANARLIAAAPDLLAACEAIISAGESENLPTAVYDAIEAAIAKANGEGE